MAETETPFPEPDREPVALSETEDVAGNQPLQIGDWLFEPSLNRLTADAGSVRLEPKLADLLHLLVQHHGSVVSKEEIVNSVWEGRFIADSALTRAMAELRRALGDDAHAPTYIETISKRGYRLVAQPAAVAIAKSEGSTLGRWVAAFAILALLLAGAFYLRGRRESPPPVVGTVSAIIVLLLEDLSPQGGDVEYFAAAMTDALMTDLARVGAFRVLSQRSLDQFAQTQGSLAGVARGLGADAAVGGSIVRTDGRVWINAQLTDTNTDIVLWADSYERELIDILSLQSEVAQAIAAALSRSVASGFNANTRPEPPRVNPLAYDLFLQGQHALKRCSREGPNEAGEFFQEAVDVDPSFAPAYAGLAKYYTVLSLFDFMPPHEGFPKARVAALRALELDPDSADAQAALAHVEFMFDWNWEQAERGFLRAIELNSNNTEVRHSYSFFLTCMGRFDEAVDQALVEIEIDPLNSRHHLAWVLFNARRYEESLVELERDPQRGEMAKENSMIAWNYALLGRYDEAIEIVGRMVATRGDDSTIALGILGWTLASAGRSGEAREVLGRLEELAASQERVDVYPHVFVLAALGEIDRALDLLEQAVVQRSPNAIFLAVEPFLDSLADAPRYQRLLASVDLARSVT